MLVQPRARVPIVVAPICDGAHVTASKFYLKQVLYNLAGNAAKFTDNGQITLKAAKSTDDGGTTSLTIRVQDTGRGISKDKITKLFAFGEQSEVGGATKGYGIGLTLVWHVLKKVFKTEPIVQSTVGVGTTVSFTIKLASDTGVSDAGAASVAPLFSGYDSTPRRALIVGASARC